MPLYDWLLLLHVASAFAFVASWTVFTAALLAGRRADADAGAALAVLRIVGPANVLAWLGATGTIVFGVWLVIELDAYDLWDGWIVATLAVWLVTEEALRREDLVFRQASRAARARQPDVGAVLRSRQATFLHAVGGLGMLGLLALMIFKPGAP